MVKYIMSELIVCPTCQGKKIYLGIGMVKSKCATCNAVGWISKPIEEKVGEVVEEPAIEQPVKIMYKNIKKSNKQKCR